jgi:hypothetical protein
MPSRKPIIIRNARAASLLEYFFVSSAASILIIRSFLALADYPQLGPGGLHIAHMLYGGAFMVAALILCLSSLGYRALAVSSVLGGVGFGFFIDELGKFLTRDNNYFFKPTSVIIYLIFVGLFFLFRHMGRKQTYTPLEYKLNSLVLLEDVILHDLDGAEHARLQHFLSSADQQDPLIKHLRATVSEIPKTSLTEPGYFDRLRSRISAKATALLERPGAVRGIGVIFITQAAISLLLLIGSLARQYRAGIADVTTLPLPLLAQLYSGTIALTLVLIGGYFLVRSHLKGLEYFRRALLLDLLVTEPFVFYSEQFLAVFGLAFKLVLWWAVLYLISAQRHETRVHRK